MDYSEAILIFGLVPTGAEARKLLKHQDWEVHWAAFCGVSPPQRPITEESLGAEWEPYWKAVDKVVEMRGIHIGWWGTAGDLRPYVAQIEKRGTSERVEDIDWAELAQRVTVAQSRRGSLLSFCKAFGIRPRQAQWHLLARDG